MNQPLAIVVQMVHIHGPMKGQIQEFDGKKITIGRHPSSDIAFSKDMVTISRNHAHILREGNRFKIIDVSTNGTFVNGTRISETWLNNGDVIFFTQGGPKISFLTRQGKLETLEQIQDTFGTRIQAPVNNSRPADPPPFTPEPSLPVQSTLQPRAQIRAEPVKIPLIIQYGVVLKSFDRLPITLGSGADCDLELDHPSISGPHIQIFFSQGSYMVKDLTGNGQVMINHQSLPSPAVLTPNDELLISPAGPGFVFMKGGRMAEINLPGRAETAGERSPQSSGNKSEEEDFTPKKKFLFGRLFK